MDFAGLVAVAASGTGLTPGHLNYQHQQSQQCPQHTHTRIHLNSTRGAATLGLSLPKRKRKCSTVRSPKIQTLFLFHTCANIHLHKLIMFIEHTIINWTWNKYTRHETLLWPWSHTDTLHLTQTKHTCGLSTHPHAQIKWMGGGEHLWIQVKMRTLTSSLFFSILSTPQRVT